MAGDASVLKDEIEKIQDALGEADDGDAEYDSDEPTEDQLFIDLGLSSKDRTSTYRDVSSASTSGFTGTTFEESMITDGDSKSQVYSITDSTVESNTTELPVDVETCLALNRAYQEIITEHLDQIQKSLQENREKQRLLELNLEEGMKGPKETRVKRPKDYTLPFFSQEYGMGPPPNEDVRIKDFLQEKKQDVCLSSAWTIVTQRQLINSVCKDALRNVIQPLMNKREVLENKRQLPNCENKDEINQKIEELDKEIKKKSRTKNEKLLEDVDSEKIDWMRISTVDFGGKREWFECQKMWETAIDPKINKTPWTKNETQKLEELVEKYGTGHWEQIVEELGTKRSPFQAMQYYQTEVNCTLKHRTWLEEEDKMLKKAYESHKDVQADKVKWQRISYLMEARSADQCRKRWISVDPSVKHSKWTTEEDVRLMLAVKLLGSKDWVSCSKYIPQRNASQCRERYCNYLDPSLKLGKPFSYDEDKRLLMLVKKFGAGCWSKMVPHMPGRTDHNLLSRYKKIQQWKSTINWFHKQPNHVQRMLKGLPAKKGPGRETTNVNWKTYYRDYGLLPDHYEQQEKDRKEHGEDNVIPLPPLLQFPPRGPKFKTRVKFKDRLAVSNYLDKTLEGKDLSDAEKEKQKIDILMKLEMEEETSKTTSVKRLMALARQAPKNKQGHRRNLSRSKRNVYQDLCSIVKGPDKKPGSVGRPKRFFPVQPPADEKEEKTISVAILALINQALAVDGKEILKTANQTPKSAEKSLQQEKDLAILREVVLKDGSYLNSKEDVKTEVETVSLVAPFTPQTGGRRTRQSVGGKKRYPNEPTTSATPILLDDDIPSPTTTVPSTPKKASAVTSTPTESPVSTSMTSTPSKAPPVLKSTPLKGSSSSKSTSSSTRSPAQSRVPPLSSAPSTPSTSTSKPKGAQEELPFLTPNVSNLRGFKSLLLERPDLVKRAGNCYAMIRGLHIQKPLDSFLRPRPPPFTEIKPVPTVEKQTPKQNEGSISTSVNATTNTNANNETVYESPKSKADKVQSVQVIYVYPKSHLEQADIVVPEDKMVGKPDNNLETVHIRKNLTLEEEEEEKKTLVKRKNTAKKKKNVVAQKLTGKRKTKNEKKDGAVANDDEIMVINAEDDSVVCQSASKPNQDVSSEEKMMNSIKESEDYKKLRARFQSIFMWPALLSSTYSRPMTETDIQDEQILSEMKDNLSKRFGVYKDPVSLTLADQSELKRSRGRPRIHPKAAANSEDSVNNPGSESSNPYNPLLIKRRRGRPPIHPKPAPNTMETSSNNPDAGNLEEGNDSNDGETPGKTARGRPKGSKTRVKTPVSGKRRQSARQESMPQPVYKPTKLSLVTPNKSDDFHSYCFTGMKMMPKITTKFHPMNLKTEDEENLDLEETENSSEGISSSEFDSNNVQEEISATKTDLDPESNETCDPHPLKTEASDLEPKTVNEACDLELNTANTDTSYLEPETVNTKACDLDPKTANTQANDHFNEEPIDIEIQPIKRKRGRPPSKQRKRGRPKKRKVVKIEFNNTAADNNSYSQIIDQSPYSEQTSLYGFNQSKSSEQANSNEMDQSKSSEQANSNEMDQSKSNEQVNKKEASPADTSSETNQPNSAMDESNQSEPLVVKLEFKPLTTIKSDKENDQSEVEVKQEADASSIIIEMDQSDMGDVDGVVIKQEVIMEAMEES